MHNEISDLESRDQGGEENKNKPTKSQNQRTGVFILKVKPTESLAPQMKIDLLRHIAVKGWPHRLPKGMVSHKGPTIRRLWSLAATRWETRR